MLIVEHYMLLGSDAYQQPVNGRVTTLDHGFRFSEKSPLVFNSERSWLLIDGNFVSFKFETFCLARSSCPISRSLVITAY